MSNQRLEQLFNRVKANRERAASSQGQEKTASAPALAGTGALIKQARRQAELMSKLGAAQLDLLSEGVLKVAAVEVPSGTMPSMPRDPDPLPAKDTSAGTPSNPKSTSEAGTPMGASPNSEGNPDVYKTPHGDGGTPPTVTDSNLPKPSGEPESPEILSLGDTATDTSNPQHPVIEGTEGMPKASSVLRNLVGGRELIGDDEIVHAIYDRVVNRCGIKTAEQAVQVFHKTASRHGMSVEGLADALGLADGSYREDLLKIAFMEELDENEVSEARSVVDGAVKARQELPTSAEVCDVAKVSPLAADIAIAEAAEIIAATGGSVAAPGANAMAMDVPPAMGGNVPAPGVPMGAGAPPMAAPPMAAGGAPPMDPAAAGGAPPMAAGGAPPMDPAAAGGAPPMDPAAAGGAPPAEEPKTASALRRALALMKQSAETQGPEAPTKEDPEGNRESGLQVVDPKKTLDGGTERTTASDLISDKEHDKVEAVAGSQKGLQSSDSGTAEATELSDTETTTGNALTPKGNPLKGPSEVVNDGYEVDVNVPSAAVPGTPSADTSDDRSEDDAAAKTASSLLERLFDRS